MNPLWRGGMRYLDYDIKNGGCRYVFLSNRAYAAIISEVLRHGNYETGGVLLGNAYNKNWFVTDCIDPGVNDSHGYADFQLDVDYVNRIMDNVRYYYKYPLTFLGFWHRHPGDMDYFSGTDERTIRSNLRNNRHGILSMLVNIDPDFRMTFYYCYDDTLMLVPYDVGDAYFPKELLQIATPKELTARLGPSVRIPYRQRMDPNRMPDHLPDSITRTQHAGPRTPPRPVPPILSASRSQEQNEQNAASLKGGSWSRAIYVQTPQGNYTPVTDISAEKPDIGTAAAQAPMSAKSGGSKASDAVQSSPDSGEQSGVVQDEKSSRTVADSGSSMSSMERFKESIKKAEKGANTANVLVTKANITVHTPLQNDISSNTEEFTDGRHTVANFQMEDLNKKNS